ncbi:MAG: hypothetical protein ACM34K_16055 [Bacillota bacterium]
MRNLNSSFTRVLVAWYGIFQIIHLVSLIRAAIALFQGGSFTFPALPPRNGWQPQAAYFLLGMGIIDTFNIIISLIFVYGYFTYARWRLTFGVLTLTVMMYSALIFAFGTIFTGAWKDNFVSYTILLIAFIPVIILYFLFTVQALRVRFYESSDSGTSFY